MTLRKSVCGPFSKRDLGLTSICHGQTDETSIHSGRPQSKDSRENRDERSCEVGKVVQDPVGLPQIPETTAS